MLVLRDDLWVPERDTHCWKAMRYEQGNVQEVMKFVPRRAVAVQAGGNFGVFARLLAKDFGAVYTFEPHPENFAALVRNTEGIDNIIKFQAGLGLPRLFSMTEPDPDNFGAFQANGPGFTPMLSVDQLPLKACGLIWLDIEGGEYDGIWGARETIRKFHPTIVLEYRGHASSFGYSDDEVHKMVLDLGYEHVASFGADKVYR